MSAKLSEKAEAVMDATTNTTHGADQSSGLPGLCRSLFEGSPLPMALAAAADHIVSYVNPAFCRMAGKSEEELLGNPFAEIMPGDECASFLDRVYRTAEAETHTEPEHTGDRQLYLSYALWPILGADERAVGVVFKVRESVGFEQAMAMNQELLISSLRQHELTHHAEKLNAQLQHEITERKRMEGALLQSEKLAATARLASTMAHEINNPLGAITNLIYLLTPLQNTPEAKAYIATLDEQVRGLARISAQMLKFHRDSNQPTEFKLAELLLEVADFYRPQAQRKGVLFNQRCETEGLIKGFKGEIVQVFTNLLLNALDATPAGGKVLVHLYPAPRWLCKIHKRCGYCLSVADTGSGIDSKHKARIFEPFYTTKGEKGNGLGLWLCMGIVNRIGGSIRVWSRNGRKGSGTCFSVFLPAEEPTVPAHRRRYERDTEDCAASDSHHEI